ncbi:MAG: LysR family transcriptional regulator [Paracoccaceae bacterium]
MQTRALRTLTQIAQSGSFAAAAEHLNMTLSAVSMQIKALETELQTDLFDRSHRPPQLTPQGRAVCAHAEALLTEEAAMQATCSAPGPLAGRFRLGFVATASIRLLPDFLLRAQTEAPGAQFDIETGTSEVLEARVSSGQLDAAIITASKSAPKGLNYTQLRREQMVFAGPGMVGTDNLPHLFSSLTFFHFQANSGIGKLIADHVSPFVTKATRVLYLDSVEAIMECVNRGLGFTLLPEPDVHRSIGPDAATRPAQDIRLSRSLALATTTRAPEDQRAELARLLQAPKV